MVYLTSDDFSQLIAQDDLEVIVADFPEATTQAVNNSLEEASSYLRHRYDMPTEFGKESEERNPQLVTVIADIALYHLHSRISPRNIPDLRVKRYDDAINFLKMAAKGTITINLPIIDPEQGHNIVWGSNTKNNNYL